MSTGDRRTKAWMIPHSPPVNEKSENLKTPTNRESEKQDRYSAAPQINVQQQIISKQKSPARMRTKSPSHRTQYQSNEQFDQSAEDGAVSKDHDTPMDLYGHLFNDIDHKITTLLALCDRDDNDECCSEAIIKLNMYVNRFSLLLDRSNAQRAFSEGRTSAAAWEVSTHDMTATQYLIPPPTEVMTFSPPSATVHKSHALRASAQEFQPTVTASKHQLLEPGVASPTRTRAQTESNITVAPSRMNVFPAMEGHVSSSTASQETHSGQRSASISLPSPSNQTAAKGETQGTSTHGKITNNDGVAKPVFSRNISGNVSHKPHAVPKSAPPTAAEVAERLQMESRVQQAREKVWMEAEALVDAALAAEDQQWASLGMFAKKTLPAVVSTARLPSLEKLTLEQGLGLQPSVSDNRASHAFIEPLSLDITEDGPLFFNDGKLLNSGVFHGGLKSGSILHSNSTHFDEASPHHHQSQHQQYQQQKQQLGTLSPGNNSTGGFPLSGPGTASTPTHLSYKHAQKAQSFSQYSSPYHTPNGSLSLSLNTMHSQSFISPTPNSASKKALHEKLSSPDRRKTHNSDELRRRLDQRLLAAEENREWSLTKRVQKASIVSERVKQVVEKEAQKLTEKGQKIEAKHSKAEKLRTEQVNIIKERAGNENLKVDELHFINALNSEGLADELNRKLLEVESRVLAAEGRRLQLQQDRSSRQRNKNSKRVQQVSEKLMEEERMKMERFEKLQEKLRAVEERKNERLAEMKRRDNESAAARNAVAMAAEAAAQSAVAEVLAVKPDESAAAVGGGAADKNTKTEKSKGKKHKKKGDRTHSDTDKTIVTTTAAEVKFAETAVAEKHHQQQTTEDECVSDVTASLQCIADAYQAMQVGVSKKVTSTARTAFVDSAITKASAVAVSACIAAKATESVSEDDVVLKAREEAQLTHMLRAYTAASSNAYSSNSHNNNSGTTSSAGTDAISQPQAVQHPLYGSAGRYHTIALQLLAAGVPITTNACVSDRSSSQPYQSAPVAEEGSTDESAAILAPLTPSVERQVKLNISLVLCTVDVTDQASVDQFIADGGVLLLRVLIGYECGVLSAADTFSEILNCAVDPTLGKSLGHIVFELIRVCAQTVVGRQQVYTLGMPLLLADVVSVLFTVQETLCKDAAHFYSDTTTVTTDTVINNNSNNNHNANKHKSIRFPYCVNVLLPFVVRTVASLLSTGSAEQNSDKTSCDAYLWYLFCSPVYASLCTSIRSDVQCLQYRQSYDFQFRASKQQQQAAANANTTSADTKQASLLVAVSTAVTLPASAVTESGRIQDGVDYKQFQTSEAKESIICNSQLLTAIGAYLRSSGGAHKETGTIQDRIVHSITQLSPQTHTHSKGRQLASLIRRSEVVGTLVSLLYSLILDFEHSNQEAANKMAEKTAQDGDKSDIRVTRRGNTVNVAVIQSSSPSTQQLRVYAALVEALYAITSADISLAQQLNKDQQVQLINSVNYLIRSYVTSLDDGNTVNVFNDANKQFTKAHAEEAIRKLFMTTALCCLRCETLQKECANAANIRAEFSPPISTSGGADKQAKPATAVPTSLLLTFCGLSNKFYKDKKFKHCLLPCLVVMSVDTDACINVLRSEGKLTAVSKYLDFYLSDYQRLVSLVSGDDSSSGGVVAGVAATTTGTAAGIVSGSDSGAAAGVSVSTSVSGATTVSAPCGTLPTDPVDIVVHISRLFPLDFWKTALVTFSSR